jgi:exodeoxyribonuclease V beta subunit
METFDCLARSTPILGPHFLEASAGTGKTFAIEHIVARLLLSEEPSFDVEQILVVTFTKAAARELKLRIRSNLEKIQKALLEEKAPWDYLIPYLGSQKALYKVGDALAVFDRAAIYTIHSFCYRALKEHSFEAGLGMGIQESRATNSIDLALRDFFESKLALEIICPEQLGLLLKEGMDKVIRRFKKPLPKGAANSFSQLLETFTRALTGWKESLDEVLLMADFEALQVGYKAEVKGRFKLQVEALARAFQDPASSLRTLIAEKGSLLEFLSPENRKVRAKAPAALRYPTFFDWARSSLEPIVSEGSDTKRIFHLLASIWEPIGEKIAAEENQFGPDDILRTMGQAIRSEQFRSSIQQKYRAALIDEFQDTDPIQWNIFQTLFLNRPNPLYLVGDPKQSIYRFRNADLYTYLKAKESIDSAHHYHLDTNFRSSPQLIESLNRLFSREWLKLPKEGKVLAYHPVRAGLKEQGEFSDGRKALHAFQYEGEAPEQAYGYLADQIIELRPTVSSLSSFAVLVKDRHMARAVQKALSERGIMSLARSQEPLSETFAFEVIEELLEALAEPKDLGKAKAVLGGPLAGFTADQLVKLQASPFVSLRGELDQLGFAPFCTLLWQTRLGAKTVQEQIASQGLSFYSDCHQVLEALFEWERSEGFSFEGAFRFLESIHQMDPDDALCRRRESDADAVQIMTMHVSKGLEFEIVFALGLAARTPAGDVEGDAEKLRQLYVAMTRAKQRLYIPFPSYSKGAPVGTHSPIELFCQTLSKEELEAILKIEQVSISHRTLPAPLLSPLVEPIEFLPRFSPSYLLSFTSLAQEAPHERLAPLADPTDLPRGAETGVAIHTIFERYFGKDPSSLEKIVEEVIRKSPLAPWHQAIVKLVEQTLSMPLSTGFTLRDLDPTGTLVEAEFLFKQGNDYIKGFIDLIFELKGKIYLVDWKTNWLGDTPSCYTEEKMREAIRIHQYDLQAKLYTESLRRSLGDSFEERFGGALYLFVRGPAAVWLKGYL